MLTQKRLLQNTPAIVKERAKACHIKPKRDGRYVEHKKNVPAYELSYIVHCTDGARRVLVRYLGSDKPVVGKMVPVLGYPDTEMKVWVSCSCPFHMFYVEYALAQQKSSEILYGNGKPPVVRNSQKKAYLCKHSVLALETAVKDYKSLSKDKKLNLSLEPTQPGKTPGVITKKEPKVTIPETPIKPDETKKVTPKIPVPTKKELKKDLTKEKPKAIQPGIKPAPISKKPLAPAKPFAKPGVKTESKPTVKSVPKAVAPMKALPAKPGTAPKNPISAPQVPWSKKIPPKK